MGTGAADDWRALYPFQSHWATIGGHRYHYIDEGQGETLLFVHGNPTWSFYWRELIRGLRGQYRTIAVDHIGCGLSDKPEDYSYRLARRVADLQSFVRELDLHDITLVAHDWGGAIGLTAAAAEPDRFARFVILNSAAFRYPRMPLRIRVCRTPLFGKVGVRGLNLFARAALRMAVTHHERMTPAVRAGLLAPYDNWAHRAAIHEFVRDIPMGPRHPSYRTLFTIESFLPMLRAKPWLFIWGMKDWCFTPDVLKRFLEFIPEADVERFEDAGHYVVEDAHERIVPVMRDWLNRRPLGTTAGQSL